jgi:error-prone DNA polymerase
LFDTVARVGYQNPPIPWRELEARLSGRPRRVPGRPGDGGAALPGDGGAALPGDGGDSPAWSYKRPAYEPPADLGKSAAAPGVPYAELHCHSNFSFLDGGSHPEEMVEEAARLGLGALAITDHDGMYGVVRFAEAARAVGVPTVFGAEVSLGLTRPQNGVADPEGSHLVVLARDPAGYTRLCRALSVAHMSGREKGRPVVSLETLAAIGRGALPDLGADPVSVGEPVEGSADHWVLLTGCRKGTVPASLVSGGPSAGMAELRRLQSLFGQGNVVVELWDHGDPVDSARNDALVQLADRAGAEIVATNNVHYHNSSRRRLATALAAVRARRSLDELDGWMPPAAAACLRGGEEQARRFSRYPGVVERAAALGSECAFDLSLVAPNLPPWPVPFGHTEMSWLRELVEEGGTRRYGPRAAARDCFVRDTRTREKAWLQIDHELDMIGRLGFAGYFLIVWDIVEFCRRNDIFCQGRGSAANSAVCYALGITNADAVALGLLFERFLSPERDGPPDIDVDIESDRREEAIQYVYRRYGRGCAAQVANVITYRPRSAVRDMGKALGASQGQADAWAKEVDHWGPLPAARAPQPGAAPAEVMTLAAEVQHFPRHLGIHSGGMVICDRPVAEVCPVEWARMADRSVLQWDKDDCAAAGLVKFDMLGLGMLTVLHATVDHVRNFHGVAVDLAHLPQEDCVYQMLSRADSVGVFQVESRAQMATLPRLKPREFYDLVVEVALIRPGPIQGGSVHPYIRRRNGAEEVTYLHPLLERSLAKTLGIPLFQEQLMQMAIDVAGFTPGESDKLRQAMGSKRSRERMEQLRSRFYEGMASRGITGPVADEIWEKLVAFANFGFPESHSVSFAYLVYSSAWLKYHYPAAFLAGLLDGQPMGFWSPQTLVADARRHGVVVRRPCVNTSGARSRLEACGESAGGAAVRLGLSYVRSVGDDLAARLEVGAGERAYRDIEDVVRRAGLSAAHAEALATAGAFECFGLSRREALWAAGAVAGASRLEGVVTGTAAPPLPEMHPTEENHADLWATGLSPDSYPMEFVRQELAAAGVVTASRLVDIPPGSKVSVAGVVTHRQRPATAQGVVFLNLEDETGLMNVVCSAGAWVRYGRVARSSPAMIVDGRLERVETVINVVVERMRPLPLRTRSVLQSRDFR